MTDSMDYNSAVTMIGNVLCMAGQDRRQLDLLSVADSNRITRKTELPKQEFLFSMYGKPCFPRGELVAIAGKAKSGKTFVSSMLMAACFRNEVLGIRRLPSERRPEGLKVLWFDTEQSCESTQDILRNRLLPMICADGRMRCHTHPKDKNIEIALDEIEQRLEIYNVRSVAWQERLPMFEALVRRSSPDLVVLDGIRDLMDDINDGKMAQTVIDSLMNLVAETGCCMVCVLHQNKSPEDSNMRGSIGTELKNKVFEAYECGKSDDRVFSFRQSATRKYDITEKMLYVVGQDGIPHLQNEWVADNAKVTVTAEGASHEIACTQSDVEQARVMRVFRTSFHPSQKSKNYRAIMGAVMSISGLRDAQQYYGFFDQALRLGIIRQTGEDTYERGDAYFENDNPP